MNDHSQRIIQIMRDKKMSATQFSEAIGIQRAAMSHITLGRNNPSADVITKIIERFEDINPGWLLTGKGMMKNTTDEVNDLFSLKSQVNTSKEDVVMRTSTKRIDENRLVEAAKQVKENTEIIEKEVILYKEKPVKKIEKLVIFFSDKTFETFVQEEIV